MIAKMKYSNFCRGILRLNSSEGQCDEQYALQSEFATRGVVPLSQRVRTASLSSAADCNRGNSLRERDVRVGGAPLEARAGAQKTIHIAHCFEQRRVLGELSRRPSPQRSDFQSKRIGARTARTDFVFDTRLHRISKRAFQPVQLGFFFRSEIDFYGRSRRDRVSRSTAFDDAKIVRTARFIRNANRRKLNNPARNRRDGIRSAKIRPTVAAGSGDRYLKTARSNSLRGDVFDRRSVDRNHGG